jgi:hypothetical protein
LLDSHNLEERGLLGGGGGGGWGAGGGGEGRRKEDTGLKGLEGGRWGAGDEAARNCISMAGAPADDEG